MEHLALIGLTSYGNYLLLIKYIKLGANTKHEVLAWVLTMDSVSTFANTYLDSVSTHANTSHLVLSP